jgi:hypothetical protein
MAFTTPRTCGTPGGKLETPTACAGALAGVAGLAGFVAVCAAAAETAKDKRVEESKKCFIAMG